MASPVRCPGTCVFCPTYTEAPKSYTPESPAVLRALECHFDPYTQVVSRLQTLETMGHPADKVELIIMGGTFPACPEEYQYAFIKACYDALNGCIASNLEQAKHLNETSIHRCTGLCIETRPDWCSEKEIQRMLEFGTTRVELGVQTIDERIYHLVRRGHTVADVKQATKLLRKYGLKVYYHWMPGLPGSTPEHDLEMTAELFNNDDFKPDGLKLYPTLVIEGTELANWYKQGLYQPYTSETTVDLMIKIKTLIPKYVRIPRVMRDIPPKFILAGCKDLALRSRIRNLMRINNIQCRCIRCREYGHRLRDGWEIGKPKLHRLDYSACDGNEIFLSYEDENETLFGLLRLRIGSKGFDINPATVREIHVFGSEIPLGKHSDKAAQHKGIGLSLLTEAERIVHEEYSIDSIAVISGVGARDYFRSELGYKLKGYYMVKDL